MLAGDVVLLKFYVRQAVCGNDPIAGSINAI